MICLNLGNRNEESTVGTTAPVEQFGTGTELTNNGRESLQAHSRARTIPETVPVDRSGRTRDTVAHVRGCPHRPIPGTNSLNNLSALPPTPAMSTSMPNSVEELVNEFLVNNLILAKHYDKNNWEPRMRTAYSRQLYI